MFDDLINGIEILRKIQSGNVVAREVKNINTAIKIFDNFNNGIELLRKIQSGNIVAREVKNIKMSLD